MRRTLKGSAVAFWAALKTSSPTSESWSSPTASFGRFHFPLLLEPGSKVSGIREAGASPYLILQHEVINIPSVSVLSMLEAQRVDRPSPKHFLALVGDPIYNPSDDRLTAKQRWWQATELPSRPEPYTFSRLRGSERKSGKIISLARAKSLDFEAALGFGRLGNGSSRGICLVRESSTSRPTGSQ